MKSFTTSPAFKTAALSLGVAIGLAAQSQAQSVITNPPPWTGSVAAGLTLTRGNSETTVATATIDAKRKWTDQELLLGADGTYGDNSGAVSSESIHAFAQFNRSITDRLYYGVKLDGLSDAIADINYRFTLSPLLGYYVIKQTNDTLKVEAGPGFVLQKLGHTTTGYATLRLAESYEHKFSDKARLWESFEILPQIDKFNNYYWNAELGVETGLTKSISLRTYLQDTYYNIPATGRLKNDMKLVAAVAYKF